MNIKPIGKRILVESVEKEKKTSSGIILPSAIENKPNIGNVIAVGIDKDLSEIKVGQRVIYSKESGIEIEDNDKKYLILNIEDVLAIIE